MSSVNDIPLIVLNPWDLRCLPVVEPADGVDKHVADILVPEIWILGVLQDEVPFCFDFVPRRLYASLIEVEEPPQVELGYR